jgi:transcriptional regulator with XRE-family HTH domain
MDLADKIKQARKARKIAQGELAKRVGISTGHLSRLENGRYNPTMQWLKKWPRY